jgi:hypothetical protein
MDTDHQDLDFEYIPYTITTFAGLDGHMKQVGESKDVDFADFKKVIATDPAGALAGASLAFSILFASSTLLL